MTKFKKFRIGLWFALLCFFGFIVFPIGYAEENAPMFYGGFAAMCILHGIIRLEFE